MKQSFEERTFNWWSDFKFGGPREDAGAFARLRRSEDALDALIEPIAIELVRLVGFRRHDRVSVVSELAALLAHVRENDTVLVARALRGSADQPVMSPIRFQRLLQAEAGADRLTAFRRAVALLGGRANVKDLTRTYLDLDDPKRGRSVRIDWLLEYADTTAGSGTSSKSTTTDSSETIA